MERKEERRAAASVSAMHKVGHAVVTEELALTPGASEKEGCAAAGQVKLGKEELALALAAVVAVEREEERWTAAGAPAVHKTGLAVMEACARASHRRGGLSCRCRQGRAGRGVLNILVAYKEVLTYYEGWLSPSHLWLVTLLLG